ncbi:MAG: ParB/RepB/Spo0J family partition protein [Acidimicrobiia bacterium]
MYQELPIDVVRPAPDNLRRRLGDVSDIVATIPTHGILEPLVVAPQDDGTYLIVAGHRRHAAATKAGLDSLPCVVRPMSDDERTLAALIENGARHDLRPTEEAAGYFRLVEAGWKIKDLAAAVGRSGRHVSARLALLELPAALRTKVDQGKVPLADAVEVLRLKAHPDALAEVAGAVVADEVDDVGWTVRQTLAGAERATRRAAVIESLAAGGVAVVDHDAYGVPDGVSALGGVRGLDVDPDAHAAERCHVVVVTRDGEQVPACNEPARHGAKGPSELKAPKRARVESEGEAERKAEQAALRDSARQRGEFLADVLGRRLPKASVVALALEAFVRSANQAPAKAACELPGLEPSTAPYGSRAADQLADFAAAGDAQRLRAGLALAFALAEEHLGASWGAIGWAQPLAVAHLGFLDACGYQRSEFEDARLTAAADALERRAAEGRRFHEPAPPDAAAVAEDDDHDEGNGGGAGDLEEAEDVPA